LTNYFLRRNFQMRNGNSDILIFMHISIRNYKATDQLEVERLFHQLQKYEHQFDAKKSIKFKNAQKCLSELLDTISEKKGELIVATSNDTVVGFIAWYPDYSPEFDTQHAYISDFIVDFEYR